MAFTVIYEDNHIIAVNKDNNVLVQEDKTGDAALEDLVKKYIKHKYNKPGAVFLGVIHRIDRPVSGIVVFARTSKALTRMNEQLKKKQIQKTYWAIVKNRPEPDTAHLEHYILRDTKKNKSSAQTRSSADAKLGSLDYRLKVASGNYYLLEIDLHTGRHHQIRCQLAKIGSPIKGDLKYGFSQSNKDGGISLHARSVEFIHPVLKEKISIVAPVPNEQLWKAFDAMLG